MVKNDVAVRTYDEMSELSLFEDRFEYLKLSGVVGQETFGFNRYLNQILYKSKAWSDTRDLVLPRDSDGDYVCDLGVPDRILNGRVIVHHMNPITIRDVLEHNPLVFDPRYLVACSHNTHIALHYGDSNLLVPSSIKERSPNDTCPWR